MSCAWPMTGCVLVPSPYSDQLNPVAKRYEAMERGISRSELETQLGKPSREEKDGPCVWAFARMKARAKNA